METEVSLDSYQTALEEVLSWLLSAEDTLQAQGEISNDVEEVKEQFHTHEVNKTSIYETKHMTCHDGTSLFLSQLLCKVLVFWKFSFYFEMETNKCSCAWDSNSQHLNFLLGEPHLKVLRFDFANDSYRI